MFVGIRLPSSTVFTVVIFPLEVILIDPLYLDQQKYACPEFLFSFNFDDKQCAIGIKPAQVHDKVE